MYIGLYVECRLLLLDFNGTGIASKDFRKNTSISDFIKIRSGRTGIHAKGQPDMMKVIMAFGNIRSAPEILRSAYRVHVCVLCRYQNKQPSFPYTTLTDWFV